MCVTLLCRVVYIPCGDRIGPVQHLVDPNVQAMCANCRINSRASWMPAGWSAGTLSVLCRCMVVHIVRKLGSCGIRCLNNHTAATEH